MTKRKPRNTTPRDEQIAAIVGRAKLVLLHLIALVVDDADLEKVQADLASLSERDIMEELACWKRMRRDVPEWHATLCQHGF